MKKEEIKQLWLDYVNGNLDEDQVRELEQFFIENPKVKEEYDALYELWSSMDGLPVPEPSSQMDVKFHATLEGYEAASKKAPISLIDRLSAALSYLLNSRPAFASTMLFIGLVVGYSFSTSIDSEQQLASLNNEVLEMKKMMMLTLLEQPRAMDRLKAVQISNDLPATDKKVVEALLKTLNSDRNVNVRIVAAQSLASMGNDPIVRSGLVKAIADQKSPMVQSTLADIMLQLEEKTAVEELKKLLHQPALDTLVKVKIQNTIAILI